MDINVIRIQSKLGKTRSELLKENDNFLAEINNELIDDDLLLVEGDKSALATLIFVETGGSEQEFVKLFPRLKQPILLLSNCKNNSLPACLEIKTYCSQNNVACFLASGDEKTCAALIKSFFRAFEAKQEVMNKNLGMIGEPSDWLIASKLDYGNVYENYKISIVKIGIEELISEINKKKMGKVPHLDQIEKKWKNKKVLDTALYIYGALKRLVKKYKLSGLSIRCFDLLGKYKNTACLALAILNDEGITCACEGDLPSLLTMHFIKALTNRPSFMANPSYIFHETKKVLFAHCTVPFSMTKSYTLDTHFESDLGIGIKGIMSNEDISIVKLVFDKNAKMLDPLVISGKIVDSPNLKEYCRTQIMVELQDYDYFNFLKSDFGNHVIVTYNDIVEDFYALMALIKEENKDK